MKIKIIIILAVTLFATSVWAQKSPRGVAVLDSVVTVNDLGERTGKDLYLHDETDGGLTIVRYSSAYPLKELVKSVKTVYGNDDDNTLYTMYLWNDDSNKWELNYKYEYEIDADSLPVLFTLYEWDRGDWNELQTIKYEYNVYADSILYTAYTQKVAPDMWAKYAMNYVYYEPGTHNILSYAYYYYPPDSTSWLNGSMTRYSYDAYGQLARNTMYMRYNGDADWHLLQSSRYYYSLLAESNAPSIQSSAARVSPNPATSFITISGAVGSAVSVYGVSGLMAYHNASISDHETIDVSGWPVGIYLVCIQSGGKKEVRKIIKR